MPYTPDPSMPSGWRYVAPTLHTKQAPAIDGQGNPYTATLTFDSDGNPHASTPEQVADILAAHAAAPMTFDEKLNAAQRAGITYELGADQALQTALDNTPAGIERRASPVVVSGLSQVRAAAAELGYGVVVHKVEASGIHGDVSRSYMVSLVNSLGQTVLGPATLQSVEIRLGIDLRDRQTRRDRERAMSDHKARQAQERADAYAQSPGGRLAEIERKLGPSAETTNSPGYAERYRPILSPDGAVVGYVDQAVQ